MGQKFLAQVSITMPQANGSNRPGKTKRLTIDVPEDLHRRLKTASARSGRIMADMVRELLEKNF